MKHINIVLGCIVLLLVLSGCVIPYYSMTLEIESISLLEKVTPTLNELVEIDGKTYSRAIVTPAGIAWVHHTALPGGGSNIMLIGHNAEGAFGRLYEVNLGDELLLRLDGVEHKYHVTRIVIAPNKGISHETRAKIGLLLGPTDTERLTLLTCHGKGSTHRLIVIGEKLI